MLGIWTRQPLSQVEQFCRVHSENSGEELNPNAVDLYFAEESPYEGYRFVRLEIAPHIITRKTGKYTISANCVSYCLLRKPDGVGEFMIVPLGQSSQLVYRVNGVFDFRISPENLVPYLTFYGHVVNTPPFYFFSRMSQLGKLCSSLEAEARHKVEMAVRAAFQVDGEGRLSLPVEKNGYFLLGDAYTVRIPCFHDGSLYITKVKIADDGIPEMLNDDSLQVEGVFDEARNLNYFPLDAHEALRRKLEKYGKASWRARAFSLFVLQMDTVILVLLLPLFIFHFYVLVVLGNRGTAIFDYFEELRASRVISLSALMLGAAGTLIAVFRFVFLEMVFHLKKIIPSVWSHVASSLEAQSKKAQSSMGRVMFVFINAAEFSLRIFMVLSLLLYGVAWLLPLGATLNFGQSMVTILSKVPLAGTFFGKVVGKGPFVPVELPGTVNGIVGAVVAFLVSTVLIGLVVRLFLFANRKDN